MSEIPTTGELNFIIQMPNETGGSKGKTVGGTTPSPAAPSTDEAVVSTPDSGNDNTQSNLAVAKTVAFQWGKQSLTAAVNNIGLATGNYYAQRQAQAVLSATTTAVGLAASASNIYTFIAAVGTMAISAGVQAYTDSKQREQENYTAAQNARRLGISEARK